MTTGHRREYDTRPERWLAPVEAHRGRVQAPGFQDMTPDIDALVRKAVLAEREACARLAETFANFTGANYCDMNHPWYDPTKVHDYGRGGNAVRQMIAEAIRGRS